MDSGRYVIRKHDGSLVASQMSLGMPVHFDDYGAAADYVVVLERVKQEGE